MQHTLFIQRRCIIAEIAVPRMMNRDFGYSGIYQVNPLPIPQAFSTPFPCHYRLQQVLAITKLANVEVFLNEMEGTSKKLLLLNLLTVLYRYSYTSSRNQAIYFSAQSKDPKNTRPENWANFRCFTERGCQVALPMPKYR